MSAATVVVVTGNEPIPEATVARLPVYLRSLLELAASGPTTVSSVGLAELAGVNDAKVRKDLSYLGPHGTRGVGYNVDHLIVEISCALGVTNTWPVVICGLGNLGLALANHTGFTDRGFPIAAAVDTDPDKIGTTINGVAVHHPEHLPEVVAEHQVAIGIITTPAEGAQQTVDLLVEAGVRSILSFAPAVLVVPEGIDVRCVDLSTELQILGFHLQRLFPPHSGEVAEIS
ncbi:MAG: redox-sensing transcriptional repressor Rex [Acidimicrobiia bacterium]|nr:redox-sensing transcriptional repressor Rex [Acidimicrobiia bacterium]